MPTRLPEDDPDRAQQWQRRRALVGARIRALRLERGLSQESLALESGVARNQLIQMEHGRRGVLIERVYDIAEALGVSVSEIVVDDPTTTAQR
ncbi:helix-turn-helix domain-containing protein [Mycolicibacterium sp. jd]|uniref:helix-turn-helix domain-containing protein n=1 Tax=unclassified Mycolicibacterium TaxID=2636767 RepID=UPI00351BC6A8